MHSASKEFHMIDDVVMRAEQRACCRDVQVVRGANGWTDHKLVRAKLMVDQSKAHRVEKRMMPFPTNFQQQIVEMSTGGYHLERELQLRPSLQY